jgi:hypothetical protein
MNAACSMCGKPISAGAAATCRPCYLACCKLTWGPNESSYIAWMHSIRDFDMERKVAVGLKDDAPLPGPLLDGWS